MFIVTLQLAPDGCLRPSDRESTFNEIYLPLEKNLCYQFDMVVIFNQDDSIVHCPPKF